MSSELKSAHSEKHSGKSWMIMLQSLNSIQWCKNKAKLWKRLHQITWWTKSSWENQNLLIKLSSRRLEIALCIMTEYSCLKVILYKSSTMIIWVRNNLSHGRLRSICTMKSKRAMFKLYNLLNFSRILSKEKYAFGLRNMANLRLWKSMQANLLSSRKYWRPKKPTK